MTDKKQKNIFTRGLFIVLIFHRLRWWTQMIFSEDMEISILYTDVINLHFLTTVLFIVHIVTFSVVYILHSAYALSSQPDDFTMLMACALKLINSAPIHNVSFLFEFFCFHKFFVLFACKVRQCSLYHS